MMEVLARWESRGGAHWVEFFKDDYGYSYRHTNGGGSFGKMDQKTAFWMMKSAVADGQFQPDKNTTPMRRVV